MKKEIKEKIEDWEKRVTFNREEERFEFDGVEVNDEEDLEYIFQTIKSILAQEKQKWAEEILESLPKELETKNIGNHYDLAQRNGYNLALQELKQRIKKSGGNK